MKQINRLITTALIISLCLLISIYFLFTYKKIAEIYQNETKNVIINIKKSFLKNTVDNLIYEIELERKAEADLYKKHIVRRYETLILTDHLSDEEYTDFFINRFSMDFNKDTYLNYWTVLLWNSSTNKVLYDPGNIVSGDVDAAVEKLRPLMAHYQTVSHGQIMGFFGVSQDFIDRSIKTITADKIRNLKFDNNSYIWVNEILNYNGGKNYAVRRVQPTMPETEGMLLSTDIKDAKGNMPYLEELEGVKKSGELYFSYFFRRNNSDAIIEKLSFVKLYKDFDWVIGMGIHMDDVQDYVVLTNEKSADLVRSYINLFVVFLVTIISISLTVLIFMKNLHFKKEKTRIEQENNKDVLTSAYTRKYGNNELQKSFNSFKRNRSNPAVMMFDIDYFKNVNDTYGHDAGDKVLKEVVKAVTRNMRSTDKLVRWGGDEFVCIFNDLSKENVLAFGHKLRHAVEKTKISLEDSEIGVTISIGFSYFDKSDEDMGDVIKRADMAMYKSKDEGRNAVNII